MAKTSKAEKRAVEILKEISKLAEEYKKVIDGLDEIDPSLTMNQALILGLWCPDTGASKIVCVGPKVICSGLNARMIQEEKSRGLMGMLRCT